MMRSFSKEFISLVNKTMSNYTFNMPIIALNRILDKIFHNTSWASWEFETIFATLKNMGFSVYPIDNRVGTKIRILQIILTNPKMILGEWNIFEKCVIGATDGLVDFFTIQEPNIADSLYFVKILEALLPKEISLQKDCSDEVRLYLGSSAINQGIFYLPFPFVDDCIVFALSSLGEFLSVSKKIVNLRVLLKNKTTEKINSKSPVNINTDTPLDVVSDLMLTAITLLHKRVTEDTLKLNLVTEAYNNKDIGMNKINKRLAIANSSAENTENTNPYIDSSSDKTLVTKEAAFYDNYVSGIIRTCIGQEDEGDGPDADRITDDTPASVMAAHSDVVLDSMKPVDNRIENITNNSSTNLIDLFTTKPEDD